MAKRKAGSDLLKSLGKNKKEQMKVLYPGMSSGKKATKSAPKISKSKNVSSSSKMLASRRALAGVKDASKSKKPGFKTGAVLGAASALAATKYNKSKSAKAKAKDAADKLLKKQKDKKKHHSK